jgi:hypothetical protein
VPEAPEAGFFLEALEAGFLQFLGERGVMFEAVRQSTSTVFRE